MDIDMTCIDLSVGDLLRCSFGLSKREASVLMTLLESGDPLPVSGISSLTGRDRSVVQRALLRLVEKSLADRSQRNREGGGYEYLYQARGKEKVKRAILGKSRSFLSRIQLSLRGW
ncbi:MAG: helix-turn-helix domain-containing protein [Candidatus Micrarchaeia archaeon]